MRRADDALEEMAAWCRAHLGASPAVEIFRKGHLSEVVGLELDDGRRVVIKARPWSDRLGAVFAVQRHLYQAGFPCPAPLVGPAPLGGRAATAEVHMPRQSDPPSAVPAEDLATLLADLIDRTPHASLYPALAPPLPWVGWDHDGTGLWPWPDDLAVDMNLHDGPDWIDDAASRVRGRLKAEKVEPVIGHVDWEAHNLDWSAGRPVLVHDWDSLAIRPEPSIAGAAATVFPSVADGPVAATVAQTAGVPCRLSVAATPVGCRRDTDRMGRRPLGLDVQRQEGVTRRRSRLPAASRRRSRRTSSSLRLVSQATARGPADRDHVCRRGSLSGITTTTSRDQEDVLREAGS